MIEKRDRVTRRARLEAVTSDLLVEYAEALNLVIGVADGTLDVAESAARLHGTGD